MPHLTECEAHVQQQDYKNKLVRSLSASDYARLSEHFQTVEMKTRETLVRAHYPLEHVWFPESGQVSVLCKVQESEPIEVGMIGFEGMTNMAFGHRSSLANICQIEGQASRVNLEVVKRLYADSSDFADLIGRYHTYMIAHVCFTALSHGSFTVEERLARWLLMVQDRIESDRLPLAHEFLSWMLSVRRSGVTDALRNLRESGSIATQRGAIIITDRAILIELASGSYGGSEAEYERLLGKRHILEQEPFG